MSGSGRKNELSLYGQMQHIMELDLGGKVRSNQPFHCDFFLILEKRSSSQGDPFCQCVLVT